MGRPGDRVLVDAGSRCEEARHEIGRRPGSGRRSHHEPPAGKCGQDREVGRESPYGCLVVDLDEGVEAVASDEERPDAQAIQQTRRSFDRLHRFGREIESDGPFWGNAAKFGMGA